MEIEDAIERFKTKKVIYIEAQDDGEGSNEGEESIRNLIKH